MNKRLVFTLLGLEVAIVVYAFFLYSGDGLQLATRYSGRLSLYFFMGFLLFTSFTWNTRREQTSTLLIPLSVSFTAIHLFHLALLLTYVTSRGIELVPIRLSGGILAYTLLVSYPVLLIRKLAPKWLDYVYFYYVLLVMALTLVARLKGDFVGASPSAIHHINLALIAIFLLIHFVFVLKKK